MGHPVVYGTESQLIGSFSQIEGSEIREPGIPHINIRPLEMVGA